jgi:hypothetical protein
MSNPNRPLWHVMADARGEQWPALHRHGYAAEIRAIADEANRRYEGNDPAISLIAWLELEARRAEAGE